MKPELEKSPDHTFQIKTPVFGNGTLIPKEKYIPSQKSIRALEIAYKKKVNKKNSNSEKDLTAIKNVQVT